MRLIPEFWKAQTDLVTGALVFCAALLVFWYSPVRHVSDSRYSMLVSQSLYKTGSFQLDSYNLPRFEPISRDGHLMDGDIYQLEWVNNHLYYYMPPGSSVLSVPYVALLNLFGISAANPDGSYNHPAEIAIERGLAAILMAVLAAVFYFTARLFLPLSWSVAVVIFGALGTQVWSTASRAVWSHTWAMLLLAIIIYQLAAAEIKKSKLHPVLLATLLAWTFFVRPNNSVFIIAISCYVFLYYRSRFRAFAITGALWLAGFAIYSWHNFGQLLPSYYRTSRLSFDVFRVAFPGNLISPGRGLLVYVPVIIFITYLLARYWKERPAPRLIWLALIVVPADLIAISGFPHWWGGGSYGPRLSAEVVPWLVLLGVVALKAWLRWKRGHPHASRLKLALEAGLGALLLAASIFINARGALAWQTWKWNETQGDMALLQKKLWDWRQPQFLAGLIRPPLDREYPKIDGVTHLDLTKAEADKFLWYGWSEAEPEFRWTEEAEAAIIFATDRTGPIRVMMNVSPFLVQGVHVQQRITVKLNGQTIQTLTLKEPGDHQIPLELPAGLLRVENVLTLEMLDAISPERLKLSGDPRTLGVAVKWIQFEPREETAIPGNQ